MSARTLQVTIKDAEGDRIIVQPVHHRILIGIFQGRIDAAVALTPAQSATLRAALEAAEQGMS